MAESHPAEDKKTIVAFVIGLVIGGLLVWAFSDTPASAPTEKKSTVTSEESSKPDVEKEREEDEKKVDVEASAVTATTKEAASLPRGEGVVEVGDVKAGSSVALSRANYPMSEGWIGVRSYQEGRLGSLLGVVRFSESQGLVPDQIVLQYPTRAGAEYAIVMYSEDGDRTFNLASDKQEDKIFATFTAN